jgi:hypothetical protein
MNVSVESCISTTRNMFMHEENETRNDKAKLKKWEEAEERRRERKAESIKENNKFHKSFVPLS